MLEPLTQQELDALAELDAMAEMNAAAVPEPSPPPQQQATAQELAGEILTSAQQAAQRYIESLKHSGGEKTSAIAEMEMEAKRLRIELEMRQREQSGDVSRIIGEMRKLFEWQMDRLKTMYAEFQAMINDAGL